MMRMMRMIVVEGIVELIDVAQIKDFFSFFQGISYARLKRLIVTQVDEVRGRWRGVQSFSIQSSRILIRFYNSTCNSITQC